MYLLRLLIIALGFFFKPSHCHFPFVPNDRLIRAFVALQAWKVQMIADPKEFTYNWEGPDVCSYNGVFCAPAPDDPLETTVAGIDLNGAGISGYLPPELGLLTDLALLHLNSNYFCGTIPEAFISLQLLFELDISNNDFSGPFPCVIFDLSSLKYLDIRFNKFDGEIPPEVFNLKLDALFINDNKFKSALPENFGNTSVSVFVAANTIVTGCIPKSIGNLGGTLDELILSNLGLTGCFRNEIQRVKSLRVLDVSSNGIEGLLTEGFQELTNLEVLNIDRNKLRGHVPLSICSLPKLQKFSFAFNFFSSEPQQFRRLQVTDDRGNCIPNRANQRSPEECRLFYASPFNCKNSTCS